MMRALFGRMAKSAGFDLGQQVQREQETFVEYEVLEEKNLELREMEKKNRERR